MSKSDSRRTDYKHCGDEKENNLRCSFPDSWLRNSDTAQKLKFIAYKAQKIESFIGLYVEVFWYYCAVFVDDILCEYL